MRNEETTCIFFKNIVGNKMQQSRSLHFLWKLCFREIIKVLLRYQFLHIGLDIISIIIVFIIASLLMPRALRFSIFLRFSFELDFQRGKTCMQSRWILNSRDNTILARARVLNRKRNIGHWLSLSSTHESGIHSLLLCTYTSSNCNSCFSCSVHSCHEVKFWFFISKFNCA